MASCPRGSMENVGNRASSRTSKWTILEYELRCPVCNDYFTDPAILSCAHHVCLTHLGNVSSRERIACPVCSDVTQVPDGGVPVDRVLHGLLQLYQMAQADPRRGLRVGFCGFCEERPASRRCVQCAGVLCDDCVEASHSKGFFRTHTIVPIEDSCGDADSVDLDWKPMLCDCHPEEKLNFYCLDCRRPVCSHCLILGDHKGHQQTPVDQAFETGKETLSAWVDKLQQRITCTEEIQEQIRAAELEIRRGAEAQVKVINKEMDHLRELVETKRSQLLSKSTLEESQKKQSLQSHLQRIEVLHNDATALISRATGILGLTSEHAFLSVVLPVIQDMKKCSASPIVPPQLNLTFRPLSTDAQVRSLGDIDLGHTRHASQQMLGSYSHSGQVTAPAGQPVLMHQQRGVDSHSAASATLSHMQPQQGAVLVGQPNVVSSRQSPGGVHYVYRSAVGQGEEWQ